MEWCIVIRTLNFTTFLQPKLKFYPEVNKKNIATSHFKLEDKILKKKIRG
jgi:hypothetical protein